MYGGIRISLNLPREPWFQQRWLSPALAAVYLVPAALMWAVALDPKGIGGVAEPDGLEWLGVFLYALPWSVFVRAAGNAGQVCLAVATIANAALVATSPWTSTALARSRRAARLGKPELPLGRHRGERRSCARNRVVLG